MHVNYYELDQDMYFNHFNKTSGLVSKYGLCISLAQLTSIDNSDYNRYFPKCYDLYDEKQFEDFIQEYKLILAWSVVERFKGKMENELERREWMAYLMGIHILET